MVGSKSIQTRVVEDNNKQNAPYILFSSNQVESMKEYDIVGMHFVYCPYNSCMYTFLSYHPYLPIQFSIFYAPQCT